MYLSTSEAEVQKRFCFNIINSLKYNFIKFLYLLLVSPNMFNTIDDQNIYFNVNCNNKQNRFVR